MNARAGTEAHVLGFMCKRTYRNLTIAPLHIYEYWIVPRNYDAATWNDAQLQDDFHTRHGLAEDKDGSWVNNLSPILYNEPVNSEKYLVLKKKRTLLAGQGQGSRFDIDFLWGKSSCVELSDFIRLDRKYTYGSFNDSEPQDLPIQPPVYYIFFAANTFGRTETVGSFRREHHVVTYFRDAASGMK